MVDSRVYPGLERKPGKQNWVDYAGGLPSYIERIAKHLHYEKGMTISRAIAVAVNTVKRWALGGTVTEHGTTKRVSAKTQALAAKAVAEWELKKRKGSLRMSEPLLRLIDLSTVADDYAIHLYNQVVDLAEDDTPVVAGTSAESTLHDTLHAGGVNLSEGGMDIQALAERADRVEDPRLRRAVATRLLDLAVNPSAEQRRKYGMADGSYPVWNRASLKSAIGLARTPAQRRHVMARARALGLSSMIPDHWRSQSLSELAMQGIVDLASTIAPRSARGRVSDGRRSYRKQGRWGHGFVPLDQAAKESKAKGSPIAIRRLNRLYSRAATGTAGQRASDKKSNTKRVNVDEKSHPGSEKAQDIGQLRNSPFGEADNRNQVRGGFQRRLPTQQKEASKSSRIPNRARQDWDQIPENLKTVRNGKRYVYAEFGGKGFITPWVGGVHGVSQTPLDKRKVYRTLAPADAQQMTEAQLRAIVNNPKTPPEVRTIARRELRKKALENRTKEASQKP